ncbi:hypothetical protein CSA37_08905 [Candidatus Fermentibacteria bacterium]|nr:MAG: hypothetical protein CSA37_08905 [Candidatus Fermentibacteria bacterium]
MRKALFTAALLLVLACGNSGIELNNGTGMNLDSVTLSIGENSKTWENVEADQTVKTGLDMLGGSNTVRVEWQVEGRTEFIDYEILENAADAKRVSILFAPDEVSINYSF